VAELTGIESKLFTARDFRLESGQSLPVLELAYETYGSLSSARDNAVLIVHGYTSSHHAAGRNAVGQQGRGVAEGAAGWFDGLIGPGKAVDTNRSFVVSVNALGSAHGSSGPNCTDPRTGKPYGPTFPDITMRDIVAAEKLLVDSLGLNSLVAVSARRYVAFSRSSGRLSANERRRAVGDGAALAGPPRPAGGAAETAGENSNWNGGWCATMAASPKRSRSCAEDLGGLRRDRDQAGTMPDPKRARWRSAPTPGHGRRSTTAIRW
jgi:homoserine O-acetyltransferase